MQHMNLTQQGSSGQGLKQTTQNGIPNGVSNDLNNLNRNGLGNNVGHPSSSSQSRYSNSSQSVECRKYLLYSLHKNSFFFFLGGGRLVW